jgi:predicted transcriptional regulator
LLQAIRAERPRSVYALARRVGRHLKNVQDDLRLLEEHGLVRMHDSRSRGRRRARVPETPFDEIALKIAI